MSSTREEGKRDQLGFRTQLMHARFEEQDWPIVSVGNKHYLEIEGTKYRIVDGGVTGFLSENLVSIGAGLGRELIILIQQSPTLEQYSQLLKDKIKALPKGTPTESIIKIVIEFVRNMLDADAVVDLEKSVNDFCAKQAADPKTLKYKGHPVITMGEFVREKKGVCRHHALLLCYMLNRLMVNQLLPEGEIHHTRDNITNGGAHVWVMYMPKNSSAIYLVDSLWNKLVDLSKVNEVDNRDLRGYGLKALANCKRRFVDIEASPVKEKAPSVRNEVPIVKKQGLFAPAQKVDSITAIYQLLNIKLPSEAERKRLELKHLQQRVNLFNIRQYYPEIKDACKLILMLKNICRKSSAKKIFLWLKTGLIICTI